MIGEMPLAAVEGQRGGRWGVPRCSRGRRMVYVRLADAPRSSAALPMGHGISAATCLFLWQDHKHLRGRQTSATHQLYAMADDEVVAESQRGRRQVLTYLAVTAVERALAWVCGLQHRNILRC